MGKRSNGEGSRGFIVKNGKRIYRIRVFLSSGQYKDFTGKTQAAAEEKYKKWKETGSVVLKQESGFTVGDGILWWLTNIKQYDLRKGTYQTYCHQIKGELLNFTAYDIRNIYLKNLTHEHVNRYYQALLPFYAYKTLKDNWIIFKQFLEYANENAWSNLTIAKIKLPNAALAKPKRQMHPLCDKDIAFFQEECLRKYTSGKMVHPSAILFLFLLCTGMRIDEALALEWSDIRESTNEIIVNKTLILVDNQPTLQRLTKTEGGMRKIPLSNNTKQVLAKITPRENCSIVFPTKEGSYHDYHNFYRSLNAIVRAVKKYHPDFQYDHITPHDMRHTFASKLIREGCSAKEVQVLLGHSDVSVTLNTYIHVFQEQSLRNMNQIDIFASKTES